MVVSDRAISQAKLKQSENDDNTGIEDVNDIVEILTLVAYGLFDGMTFSVDNICFSGLNSVVYYGA